MSTMLKKRDGYSRSLEQQTWMEGGGALCSVYLCTNSDILTQIYTTTDILTQTYTTTDILTQIYTITDIPIQTYTTTDIPTQIYTTTEYCPRYILPVLDIYGPRYILPQIYWPRYTSVVKLRTSCNILILWY